MLKGLKNKDKAKKDTKKETKNKKDITEQPKDEQDLEMEESTDLVDVEELKQDKTKVKQVVRKKNEYELQQKQIDVSTIKLAKKEEEKPKFTTFQVANSVDEVMKKDFKMQSIEHQFMSLTDQQFNKKQQQKKAAIQKENENKPKLDSETGIKFAVLQKTNDQLKLERADQEMSFNKGKNIGIGIGETGQAINFTNSAINKEFAPLEKTPQQLRMEEAERREQEINATKKPTSWIGSRKQEPATQQKPSAAFKVSGWATMATQNDNDVGSGMKFAPLTVEQPRRQERKEEPVKPVNKAWTASLSTDQNKGQKFAPIQLSEQERKMQGSSRQQQEFVFVSKKDIEDRKRKREEQANNVKVGV